MTKVKQVTGTVKPATKAQKIKTVTIRLDDATAELLEKLRLKAEATYGMHVTKTDIILRALTIGLPYIEGKLTQETK
jgi:hypothetical protein